jgi:hypothetical protein
LELGDIPWISANPVNGTTTAGSADDVTVTFDSAGISLGVLRANLCINSNAPLSPTVQVPVILEVPPAPSLVLTKTVGLDPNVCATADNIIVPAGQGGTAVTYCYTVQNTGNITLTVQNLVDDQLGVLLGPDAPFEVAPGMSDFYTITTLITQTTVNLATWSAASATGFLADPAGDTFGTGPVQLDVTGLYAETDAGLLTLQMVFGGPISPPGTGNPDEVVGLIEIDRDNSSLTGLPFATALFCPAPPPVGVDYFIDISSYDSVGGTMVLFFIDEFTLIASPVGLVDATFASDGFTVEIPLSLLENWGPEEGIVDVAAVIGTPAEPTDCAPDGSALTSRLEVSDNDTATVTQDAPTGVAISDFNGSAPAAWLPIWLLLLTVLVMGIPAVFLRNSGNRQSK